MNLRVLPQDTITLKEVAVIWKTMKPLLAYSNAVLQCKVACMKLSELPSGFKVMESMVSNQISILEIALIKGIGS